MELTQIFSDIKKSFTITKKVDFEEYGLSIEMEPLTTTEEIKVLGACADYEGAQYIEGLKKHSLAYAIKKINDIDLSSEVEDIQEKQSDGTVTKKSKYLVMCDQLGTWPASVRDVLFDAFNNMQLELENRINKTAHFERFQTEEPEEQEEESTGLKKITVPDESPDMTDVEKMSAQAQKEVDQAQNTMARTELEAESNAQK